MKNTDKARKPGRKKPAPRKKPAAAQSRRKGLWRILLRLTLLGLVLLAGWMVYLDAQVTSRFEGRRFEVPSRVYARPLELYSGAPISAAALEQELALAGFHKGDGSRSGSYQRSGGRGRRSLHSRPWGRYRSRSDRR